MTQTRPDVSSPEIYRVTSPSRTQFNSRAGSFNDFGTQSTQRHPLRTISVDDLLESPEGTPLKRLRRRGSPSLAEDTPNDERQATPSPTHFQRPRNAFEDMLRAQARKERVEKRLEKSAFVAGEAEESDDDDQFGFGGHRKKDDGEEDDGEDQDKTLEGLVDDTEMDDTTMAEELVMEKVK